MDKFDSSEQFLLSMKKISLFYLKRKQIYNDINNIEQHIKEHYNRLNQLLDGNILYFSDEEIHDEELIGRELYQEYYSLKDKLETINSKIPCPQMTFIQYLRLQYEIHIPNYDISKQINSIISEFRIQFHYS